MRVLVMGGRDYGNITRVSQELDALAPAHGALTIIEGGATGADAIARAWWKHHHKGELFTVRANWNKHGKAAGPIRNQMMLDDPPSVLATDVEKIVDFLSA